MKKSEDSYQILVENLREDYFFYRHQRGEVFQNVSPSIRNILGYTPTEFRENYNQYKADRLAGDYLKRHRDLFESGIKHPPFEIEVIHKDKSKRILEVKEIPIVGDNNEIIAVEGIARDITEYKRVEGELRDKDTKFHILFESANDAILILKGEKIIDCNRKALDMFSCSVDQIIMQVPYSYKLSPPNQMDGRSSKEKGRERLIAALNGVPQFFEWKFIRLNGELFDAEMNLSHFSFNGEDYIQAIIRDITDRKKAQVALQESEAYYKDLYENSMVGLFRTQIEDGTLIDGNQATAVIFGFTSISEAINMNFKVSSLYSPERRKELLRLLSEKGYVQDFEILLRLSNGHEKSVSLSARMHEEKGILEGTIIDISKRKVAETKLAQNEEQFREILDSSRAILYKLDIRSGYYEYISPAITEILGYTPQDIYNMDVDRFKALLHPEDLGKAKNIIAKLIASVPGNRLSYTTEYRIRHKRGYYRWLSDSYVIINGDNGRPDHIIGNVFDITERKEAQEALKESELRFRKMADNIQNGVSIHENGKNVYVNDRLTEITGYSHKELLSFSEFQIAAPEEKKRLQQIGLELERTGQKLEELEFWIVRKDGLRRCIMNRYSYNYINTNILVKYIISIDITDRKLMENALRESEEKFRELANMLPQTIFECDLEGKLTYTNSRGLKQFGFSQKEFDKGLYIYDRILKEQSDQLKGNLMHLIKGEKFEQSEYTAIRKDGSLFPMLVYPNLIYKGEKVTGIRGVIIDTSNQKRIHEELKIAKEAAEAASKAKSIFLTNISHELRTPMNSIFGMTELIKKTQLSGKQYDFLKVITESSENLLSILNDIITIPKLESGDIKLDRKAFRMQDIMTSAVGIVTYQAELKKIKLIENQNFPDELIVISDPSRLNQILINILDNSIRYTEKGSIEICIDIVNETTDNVLIGFTLTDTSSKYPKKLFDALHEDFDKAHIEVYNEFGSTGLGLLIACQLIRISGSGLSIERVNNNSTRYYFEIEYIKGVSEDLDKIRDFTDSEKQEFLQNVRILLAEDEIFNQLVVLSMIEDWDCEVDVVE
ncbi:MAG: PAS domain S-box protein, partial [Bacteroidota bacterium]